ncbi:KH domain-containing protein [Perilla frutescens var. hirtella]|nr:KH domain-containing protein [Perilla frutescens var. frutescens]KAH6792361.1 KH domain-containing protein [Perilla frutescens var. hirtella]
MADDLLYAAAGGESNKRKYDDSPSPVARRATGFSSTPDSAAPPPSFNNVPPPSSEIELAKQKAQEIAARLLSNADPTKRARVENAGNGVRGFDSSDYSAGSQKSSGYGLGGPPQVASSGYPGPSRRIEIPNGRVGVIIGKGGETIKYLQLQSGAKIQVTRDVDADPSSTTRGVDLMGTADQIAKAEQLIQDVLSEAEAGGSGSGSRRMGGQPSGGADQFVMKIPNNKVGLVIGKGGETIKSMQARTGARIQVIPLHLPPGDTSQERTVQIDGTSEQIEAAKLIVDEVISENRNRNSTMSGGYPQQGYQARPPNWGQPGQPMQQPGGYSYPQPGAYPGQPPQYNQPPYSGYPQQSTSSGYPTSWDQSTAPQTQQAPQAASYDYYSQQQQAPQQQPAHGGPGAPTDASGYGYGAYGQAQTYTQGQGYGQYGYSGYAQPQQNPSAGYDNQQQGYNSKSSNASNPASDGHTASYGTQDEAAPAPGQAYNAGGQPVANPNYPPQAPNQPGYGGSYGPPQAQKPPSGQTAYAQPQQSPGSQAAAYAQSGYPQPQAPVHAGYAQTAGYPTPQPGYGAPPYGAAPATQPSYGQQQSAAYNSSYSGGGYAQPPTYPSADGSAGSDARGAYDSTTPPPQSAQPTGSAKASPPS